MVDYPNSFIMLKMYLLTTWRNLVKDKLYSVVNILGLSIGITIALLIGLWMYDELSFDKNFTNYNRIAQVVQNVSNNGEVQTWRSVPYPLAEELRKHCHGRKLGKPPNHLWRQEVEVDRRLF
jgi:hypothetical protein